MSALESSTGDPVADVLTDLKNSTAQGEVNCVAYVALGEDGQMQVGYTAHEGTDLYRLAGCLQDLTTRVIEDARAVYGQRTLQ